MSTTADSHPAPTVDNFKGEFLDNLHAVRGVDLDAASPADCYQALAYTVRRYMLPHALDTRRAQVDARGKWTYYLSAEYLLGRQLHNNLLNTNLATIAQQALAELGLSLDAVREVEIEPGLGNGGLGRLAACYLDSAATLKLPVVGYGIRYEYGIFRQTFADGWQVERPDEWLLLGTPWEIAHPELAVTVGFGGQTEAYTDDQGGYRVRWRPERTVLGTPSYYLVPGYRSGTINTLRLWNAQATNAFNLDIFNAGDYTRAVQDKVVSENISKVLYPVDVTPQGKQLRLEQQYFFVACSLRDILRRLPDDVALDQLHERVVIQLNDTHPTIAIPELMRLLLDEYVLPWERAWNITRNVFAYTCHTLLPEALEIWPVTLFERLLPRHLELIYEINRRFLDDVRARFPGDEERVRRMSLIGDYGERQVRMAYVATVGSFKVNGVARLQSRLLRDRVLADFSDLWPEKFTNVTNGVTPRRFMQLANPQLGDLITATIGEGWLHDLNHLKDLEPWADDPDFRAAWRRIKQQNKHALADQIRERTGVVVNPHAMFDVMVKRLHEYKRQLLKVLHAITVYNRIKAEPHLDVVPRVVYFGAKAAPGYQMAKLIIKLINAVAAVVNNDPDVRDTLTIVFPPNFNVTLAEWIYPAADLSEQISLAGKEASGTGNMKFALNGAVTIGTLDGANIEIRELVGPENFFLFGLTEEQVTATQAGYNPRQQYERNPALQQVLDQIAVGVFSPHEPNLFRPIVDDLLNHDPYMLLADYQGYVDRQDEVEQVYRDRERWTGMSILNTARCGYFSSDRSVHDYATQIWQVKPVDVGTWHQAQTTRGERYARRMAEAQRGAQAAGIDLTDAEWELLTTAPTTISSAMMTVTDSGLIGTVLEDGAVARAPAMTARRYGANPLITAVLVRMKEQMKARGASVWPQENGMPGQRQRGSEETLQRCTEIADVLEHKVAATQAETFKRWLVAIGEQVAQAAVEGSFGGIGGQAATTAEAVALDAIRTALRVRA